MVRHKSNESALRMRERSTHEASRGFSGSGCCTQILAIVLGSSKTLLGVTMWTKGRLVNVNWKVSDWSNAWMTTSWVLAVIKDAEVIGASIDKGFTIPPDDGIVGMLDKCVKRFRAIPCQRASQGEVVGIQQTVFAFDDQGRRKVVGFINRRVVHHLLAVARRERHDRANASQRGGTGRRSIAQTER